MRCGGIWNSRKLKSGVAPCYLRGPLQAREACFANRLGDVACRGGGLDWQGHMERRMQGILILPKLQIRHQVGKCNQTSGVPY